MFLENAKKWTQLYAMVRLSPFLLYKNKLSFTFLLYDQETSTVNRQSTKRKSVDDETTCNEDQNKRSRSVPPTADYRTTKVCDEEARPLDSANQIIDEDHSQPSCESTLKRKRTNETEKKEAVTKRSLLASSPSDNPDSSKKL